MNGIYRLSADGDLARLGEQTGPNGIAFSPDESTLYVADSATRQWMAYPVNEDGTLGEAGLLLDASASEESGSADGLKIDEQGNLWATGPGGVWVIAPDGTHLGTIKPNEVPANVAWGDADRRTLYMTARTGLYRIRVNARRRSVGTRATRPAAEQRRLTMRYPPRRGGGVDHRTGGAGRRPGHGRRVGPAADPVGTPGTCRASGTRPPARPSNGRPTPATASS